MSPASATCSECSPGDLGLENSPREDVSDPPVIPPTTNLHPLLLAEFPGLWLWDTGCGAVTRGGSCRFTGWASLHFKILSLNFTSSGSDKFLHLYGTAVLPLSGEPRKYRVRYPKACNWFFSPNNLLLQFCPYPVWKRSHQELLLPTALWKTVDLGCAEVCSAAQ